MKMHSHLFIYFKQELSRIGWVLNVCNPEDAKRVLLKHGN